MSQKSFTTRKEPIEFDIDDEVFNLRASVPAGRMTELSRLAGEMQAAAIAPADASIDPRIADFSRLAGEILSITDPAAEDLMDPVMTGIRKRALEMQALAGSGNADSMQPIFKLLAEIFEPESLVRFKRRFNGEYGAIDIGTFYEILSWVIGEALGKGITLPQST